MVATLPRCHGNTVLVRVETKAAKKEIGSIIVPDTIIEAPNVGEVVAAGPSVDIAVGARVLYARYQGADVELDGEKYLVLNTDHILLIWAAE